MKKKKKKKNAEELDIPGTPLAEFQVTWTTKADVTPRGLGLYVRGLKLCILPQMSPVKNQDNRELLIYCIEYRQDLL